MFGILCFGDSITFGRGEQPCTGWVGRLRHDIEAKEFFSGVYNLGIPGDTSARLLERFEIEASSRILFLRPGDAFIIIIAIGTNDACTGHNGNPLASIETFDRNIREIIEKAKRYTEHVFTISIPNVDEQTGEGVHFSNERLQAYDQVVKQHSPDHIIIPQLAHDEFADGLHPNAKGYERMYQTIRDHITPLCLELNLD